MLRSVYVMDQQLINMTMDIDKSDWATGGGVIAGVGAGFFFMPHNVFAFVGCILLVLGVGLIATALISRMNKQDG